VRVDEARNEHVIRQFHALVVWKKTGSFSFGENLLDAAIAHGDGMVLKNRARRLDRYDPAGAEE
jgi:hypothetical protein